jgi:hypothetical protein
MGQVRVVVTRIEPDGTMHRRMVDTAQQSNPCNWDDLAARALAIQPPYRPIPGTAIYYLRVDGSIIQVGEYDLEGPLRDLVIVVLAIGSKMLPAPNGPPLWLAGGAHNPTGRTAPLSAPCPTALLIWIISGSSGVTAQAASSTNIA